MNYVNANVRQPGPIMGSQVEQTPPFTEVTSDELLLFCTARMNNIDDQITKAMNVQTTHVNEQQALDSFSSAVKKFSPKGPQSEQDWAEVDAAFNDAKSRLGAGDPTLQEFAQVRDDLYHACHEQTGTPDNVKQAQQKVDNATDTDPETGARVCRDPNAQAELDYANAHPGPVPYQFKTVGDATNDWDRLGGNPLDKSMEKLKAGTELEMIQLQSLVSQRQVVVQLVSGMMQKIDQTQETASHAIGG